MPSRADLRRPVEWVLRLALVAVLGVALWRATHERPAGSESRRVAGGALAHALDEATRSPRIGALEVTMDVVPPPSQRAWLAALRDAGVLVHWTGDVSALALTAERVREPTAAVRVLL